MEKPKILEVVSKIVIALEPFEVNERKRIIRAALTVLGEEYVETDVHKPPTQGVRNQAPTPATVNVHVNASRWMEKNQITQEELEQVFQIEAGAAHVLNVELAGNAKKNTHSTYILVGIASFISTGEATIDDKAARAMCETLGCYDTNNHSNYMKAVGNIWSGNKADGFKLTAPGLREGAELIKKISNSGKKAA